MDFSELGLRQELLDAIQELGFEHAMPIQEQAIPYIKNDTRDLVGLAQTGTGKTAAFGLPILDQIDETRCETQALVIAPTRELCIQICNDLRNYSAKLKGMKIVPVYGGENIIVQLKQLDIPPQIVVATPGRLIDLMNRKKVRVNNIQFLVLDEADEMLNMGFQEDIETIISSTPETRRTFLFSATMPKSVERIANNYMKEHEQITIGSRNSGNENVEHIYYMVSAKDRYEAMKRIVDMNPDIYAIVFCRTRQETQDVADHLMRDGYNADSLHGDLSQAQRDAVMKKFRDHSLQILVATDVAARGLDVNDLTHVINYNLPDDIESYTHRSGRTGRAGKKGVSIAIIHSREKYRIKQIERVIQREFIRKEVPSGLDICKKQLFNLIDRMENVEVRNDQLDPLLPEIEKKLEWMDKGDIIRRFVSLEFNRFLDYYREARDLNIEERGSKGHDRSERSTKGGRTEGRGKRSRRDSAPMKRLKIDLGSRDGMTPKHLLGIINDMTGDKSINIGGIDISQRFTFFDVPENHVSQVIESFVGTDATVSEAKGRQAGKSDSRSFGERHKNSYKGKSTKGSYKPKHKRK